MDGLRCYRTRCTAGKTVAFRALVHSRRTHGLVPPLILQFRQSGYLVSLDVPFEQPQDALLFHHSVDILLTFHVAPVFCVRFRHAYTQSRWVIRSRARQNPAHSSRTQPGVPAVLRAEVPSEHQCVDTWCIRRNCPAKRTDRDAGTFRTPCAW